MDDRLVRACDVALFEACQRDLQSTDMDSATVELDDAVRLFSRAVNRLPAFAQRERALDIAAIALLVAAELLEHAPPAEVDPPVGYGVALIDNPSASHHGQWRYWTRALGCSGIASSRELAIAMCWRHRRAVIDGWLAERPELAQPLCAACGWPKDRSEPPTGLEPPIVRGALDAQCNAEERMFTVLASAPAMKTMSRERILEILAGVKAEFPYNTPESEPRPEEPRVDVLPPGIPDGT